jgi:nucleotide-binding universal stress UspA family protein
MTSDTRRIVVGVGLLGKHDPVLTIASRIAADVRAELHAVHVYDPPAPVDVAYAHLDGLATPDPAARAREMERRLREHAHEAAPEADVVCHVVEGAPSEGLVERARLVGAGMLIMGATRQDRVRRCFLGSTAQGVLYRAAMPTLLIRQPVVRPLRRVLLTTNLSELSLGTCARGLELLDELFGGDEPERQILLVIRARDEVPDPDSYHEFACAELERRVVRRLPGAAATMERRVRSGDPADCIVQEAMDGRPDLLVLGNHGYPGRCHGIGGVAAAVLREAGRNVLVIPPHAADASGGGVPRLQR